MMKKNSSRSIVTTAIVDRLAVLAAVISLSAGNAASQSGAASLPNPYHNVEKWGNLPAGRVWGSASAIDVDSKGNIWVADKCGENTCAGRTEDPIIEFDPSGKPLRSFGAGLFIAPHGIGVDKSGNVWVTDFMDKDGKGQQVIKFSRDGKALMRLGKPGVAAEGPDSFNQPTDIIVAPNGTFFVADGHAGQTTARIVKFSRDGKFLMQWGKKGSGPGEFNIPHALAFDSRGRLFVGDRGNNRIQIFDQAGKFLAEWKQFGRPSGIYIDRSDTIYVADSESNETRNPGFTTGIRVGSAKDGSVSVFIPISKSAPEGVAADFNGNIYGAETAGHDVKRYSKD